MDLIFNLFVFVLASFVGFELISKVPPTLHTPLMSGANAISGITLIGAVLIIGSLPVLLPESTADWVVGVIGFLAIVFASINVVGGFMVTDRMLEMFKKKK
jgi:NAD(P) transhydrogenase subunit alpha